MPDCTKCVVYVFAKVAAEVSSCPLSRETQHVSLFIIMGNEMKLKKQVENGVYGNTS